MSPVSSGKILEVRLHVPARVPPGADPIAVCTPFHASEGEPGVSGSAMGRGNAPGDQPGDPGGGEQPAGELRIPPRSGRVPPGRGDEWQARSRLGFLTRLAHLAPRSGADPARGSAPGRHSVLDVARLGLFRPTATNKGTSNPAWRVPMAADALTVRWPRNRPPRKAQGSHGDRRRSPESPCQEVATRSSDVRH